jgi:hypothetical protein
MSKTTPDIIYPVRSGDSNDELRFSLRSLVNVPHGTVWMVGYQPSWVTGVEFIAGGNSAAHPRANLYQNLWLACTHPGVADDVLIFNDDIYVTAPVEQVPVLFRCSLQAQLDRLLQVAGHRGWWQESLISTRDVLKQEGFHDPISYELHTPFPCDRKTMADTLVRFGNVARHNPPQWRTLYGNLHRIGGDKHTDGKALRPGPVAKPYHSTDDLSWRYFRRRFQQLFPNPSPYEQDNARSAATVPDRRQLRTARCNRA